MKKEFLMSLATCAALSMSMMGLAHADGVVENIPDNLIAAEVLQTQINAQAPADRGAIADQGVIAQEELDRGRGDRGRDRDDRGRDRDDRWRYPRPEPRPYPRPYPRPVPRLVVCYAQSTANGLTYSGSAYNAYEAQNAALNICFNATGYQCVATGCTY